MKARIKLIVGAAFAAIAVMAATQPGPESRASIEKQRPCFGKDEVDLLMRSNKWTKEQATTILDLACKYSNQQK